MLWWTLRQLKSENPEKRRQAVLRLVNVREARVVEPLIDALRDTNLSVRREVAWVLGDIGNARAVLPLIVALADLDSCVRENAVRSLGKIGDRRAVEPLTKALQDGSYGVRQAAVNGLKALRWQPVDGAQQALMAITQQQWEEVVKLGSDAVGPLEAALRDQRPFVRREAVRALMKIGDERAIEPLVTALGDVESDIRKSAIEALLKIGSPAVEPLIDALNNASSVIREEATEALGGIGDKRAVEPLVFLLRDSELRVSWSAVTALVGIGVTAIGPLITALEDENSSVRLLAAAALGEIGDTQAVEQLIELLKCPDLDVLDKAAEALGKIGDKRAVEPLLAALSSLSAGKGMAYSSVVRALGRLGDPRSVDALATAFQCIFTDTKEAAVEALGNIGNEQAVSCLQAIINDRWERSQADARDGRIIKDDWDRIREKVVDALGKTRHPLAVETLVTALSDRDSDVRYAAAGALGNIGDARAVGALLEALKEVRRQGDALWVARGNVRDVPQAAVMALGRIGDAQAVLPLFDLATKDSAIASVSVQAIETILDLSSESVSVEALRAVETLDDVAQIFYRDGNCGSVQGFMGLADCSRARQLARQELMRRRLDA